MQVLVWSSALTDMFGINGLGSTKWTLFDPTSDTFGSEMTAFTEHDMFCPAISMLADGRIHVAGGNNAEATSIYSDVSGEWVATSKMNIPRGYSSSVLLSNGQVRDFLQVFFFTVLWLKKSLLFFLKCSVVCMA
jgi:galactose oxidase